jgi:putative endonuclease
MAKTFHVYILASRTRVLYVGVTSDFMRRLHEHRSKLVPGFTARYNVNRLVHVETTEDAQAAIAREKQLKGWIRKRKIELIEKENPQWRDLSEEWCATTRRDPSLRSG